MNGIRIAFFFVILALPKLLSFGKAKKNVVFLCFSLTYP